MTLDLIMCMPDRLKHFQEKLATAKAVVASGFPSGNSTTQNFWSGFHFRPV
jgi:hypothetical protein